MNKDQVSEITVQLAVSATTVIDTQGYQSLTFALPVKDTTALSLKDAEVSDMSDEAVIAAAFRIGKIAYTAAGVGKLGYVGKKRYVEITVTDPATDVTIMAILGNPLLAPTAD